ncbi:MAG TPA: hypothetical protein V6C96_02260 [Vampirovibrionales bacterium]
MDKFIQMDIFFFISSLVGIGFLSLVIIVATYVFFFMKKVNKILAQIEHLIKYATVESEDALNMITSRIDSILSNIGIVEKTAITIVSTIFAKKIRKRAKIKKDAQKK